ncbi:MAG: CRISPR-associated endonuclease Cas1 [Anaerolineae bacterium]
MPIIRQLIADEFGTHIGKYSERLKVTRKGETLQQAPLLHLESVLVASQGVSLSADAIAACCERGIPVFFVDSRGTPFASLYAAGLTGTVLTRRAQMAALDNRRGRDVALAFASGKIRNQAATLKYLAKTRKETAPDLHEELRLCADEVLDHEIELERLEGETVEAIRSQLLGVEGRAAQKYWAAVKRVLPEGYGWPGRKRRGAADPVNQMLNYGYGILYGQVERCIVLAGLDPYAGFIHVDRPGKPSLVLDLIEEFRQEAVDRVVFGLLNKQFSVGQEGDKLDPATRRKLAERVLEHLEAGVRYERKRVPLRVVMQSQARHLATYLRGDRDAYAPFQASW